MRFMTGVATLALMLALTGSAHADDWYRLNLQAPILFSGGEVLPPDGGGNTGISITIDEAALIDGSAKGRQYGDLSVPVTISGIDASHIVSLEGLAGASWVPTGSAYGSGTVSWPGAAEGSWSPMIVVKDGDDNIVATAQLELEILPPLTASVSQNSYTVDKGDELTIQASAGNAIGNVLWGSDDDLPEWIDLDALTGQLEVDTSASNSASELKLTAVDQFDNMTASTTPFSVTVNGAVSDYWVATLGGTSSDIGWGIAVGADGAVYITGQTYSSNAGGNDFLVAKYSAAGTLAWKKTLGGTGTDYSFGIAVGADGAVYVTGRTNSSSAGGYDFFLAKYNADGALAWKKTLGGNGADYGESITVSADGAIYVTGQTNSAGVGGDVLVAKYNADGTLAWTNTLGGTATDIGQGIAIGADGAVYVTGQTNIVSAGVDDVLVAKYNADDALSWKKTLGGAATDRGYGIAIGADGAVYVGGYTGSAGAGSDVLVAKYNADGALDWTKTLGGNGADTGWGITVGADGAVYVGGYTNSDSAGGYDVLVAKYSATGTLAWKKTLVGTGDNRSHGIAVGADGAVYVTGQTDSVSAGGIDLLVARLPADGGVDMTAGLFTWQDVTLTEGDGGTLSQTSPHWDSPDADLADNPNPTGLTEGDAAALTGNTIQFED